MTAYYDLKSDELDLEGNANGPNINSSNLYGIPINKNT